jgi:hypothetical protein
MKESKAIILPEYKPSLWDKIKEKFHIPYVKIKDFEKVEDYFNLPKEEREYKGFWYRVPYYWTFDPKTFMTGDSLSAQWDKEIRKRYPIQWFFRDWLFSTDNPVYRAIVFPYWRLRDFYWNLRAWIKPMQKRTVKASRPFHYSDICGLIESVNFAMLLDFYHEDYIKNDFIDWKAQENQAEFERKLIEYVKELEVEIPAKEKISDSHVDSGEYEKSWSVDEEIAKKKEEILVWMIKNRDHFWT